MRVLANEKLFTIATCACVGVAIVVISLIAHDLLPAIVLVTAIPLLILLALHPKSIVYTIVVYNCFIKMFISDFGVTFLANYVLDVLLVLGILLAFLERRKGRDGVFWGPAAVCFLSLVISVAFSVVSHPQPLLLQLWAVRFFFRLFAFLYVCVALLHKEDLPVFERIFGIVLFINIIYCSYQFFLGGYNSGDNISGVFGSDAGGNGALNVFNVAMTAYYLFGGTQARKSFLGCTTVIVACCYIAAISELKIYYVELVLLVVMATLYRKPSLKLLCIVIAALFGISAGIMYLGTIYPSFADFFTPDSIISYASEGYSSQDTLGRFTAVQQLQALFLQSPIDAFLGLGLGSGQYSQFFASSLYAAYGETLRWTWFSGASLFLELGYFGLGSYVAFFVSVSVTCWERRKSVEGDGWIFGFAGAMSLMCIVLMVYNSSLTVEPSCYLLALCLAAPYVVSKVPALESAEGERQNSSICMKQPFDPRG